MKRRGLELALVVLVLACATTCFAVDRAAKVAVRETGTDAQKVCPVDGQPIHKEIFTDHDGFRIYFSSKKSREIFRKDPSTYMAKLKHQGIVLQQAPPKGSGKPKGAEAAHGIETAAPDQESVTPEAGEEIGGSAESTETSEIQEDEETDEILGIESPVPTPVSLDDE